MKNRSRNRRDLSEERKALVEKVAKVEKAVEILNAGGQQAEALSAVIVGFHRRLREELHPAEAETGAGDEGKDSPSDDKSDRWAHLTLDQSDKFDDALDHLEIIYELLAESYTENYSGIADLLGHPKEVLEQLKKELKVEHEVIQAEKAEREEATVC